MLYYACKGLLLLDTQWQMQTFLVVRKSTYLLGYIQYSCYSYSHSFILHSFLPCQQHHNIIHTDQTLTNHNR
jgi:hypothetical protein